MADSKPEDSKSETITLRVKDQQGEETFFKVKKGTKMNKVFSAYAQRKGVEVARFRFLIDGEQSYPTKRLRSLIWRIKIRSIAYSNRLEASFDSCSWFPRKMLKVYVHSKIIIHIHTSYVF